MKTGSAFMMILDGFSFVNRRECIDDSVLTH